MRQTKEGASKDKEVSLKKNAELRNQIAHLESELRREKERVDIKAANKKLLRLQKERTAQDVEVQKLHKAIGLLTEKMVQYTSEKIGLEDQSEA